MFERYMGAKAEKPNKWVNVTITVSVVVHVIGLFALVIYSFWKIEKLPVKDGSVLYMAAQMATPPPPPPPPPPPKKSSVKTKVEVKKSTEVVQPSKDQPKPQEEPSEEDDGEEGGVEGGVKGGEIGGVIGGEIGGTIGGQVGGTGAAPPPPPAPTNVAQAMLEGSRIAGDKNITLSDPNLVMLRNQGVSKMTVKAQMCLDAGGLPRSVDFKQSSGYPEIDARIKGEMNKWKYRPYVVAGKAVPVCFIVIFNYKIQ
jgi:protein TonB